MEKALLLFLLAIVACVHAQSLVESGNPSPAFWILVAVGGLVLVIIVGMLIWWWCFPMRGDVTEPKRVMDASGNLIVVEGTKAAMWGSPNAYQGVMGQTRVEGRLPIPLFSASGPRGRVV